MLKKWFGKKESSDEEKGTTQEHDPAPSDHSEGIERASQTGTGEVSTPQASRRSPWALLQQGLTRTRRGLTSLFSFGRGIDEEVLAQIEAELYRADFGPRAVNELIHAEGGIREAWKARKIESTDAARDHLRTQLKHILLRRDNRLTSAPEGLSVMLVAGVNGTGKTTSIAKLSKKLKDEGKIVVLAAADTFRAAAVEQLTIWSDRLGIDIVTGKDKADPGSVAYRAAETALERGADVLIVDTAGRLHTQQNLMRELVKIRNVLGKKIPGAPHEALLVLDATTGQNALSQAKSFLEAIQVTGIVLAKLDGTAKGGIVVTINNELEIPVKLVGIGEGIDDLEEFDPERFVDALFEE